MIARSISLVLSALCNLAEATSPNLHGHCNRGSVHEIHVRVYVVHHPVAINSFFTSNTIISINGGNNTININNAPTQLNTTAFGASTITVTSTVTTTTTTASTESTLVTLDTTSPTGSQSTTSSSLAPSAVSSPASTLVTLGTTSPTGSQSTTSSSLSPLSSLSMNVPINSLDTFAINVIISPVRKRQDTALGTVFLDSSGKHTTTCAEGVTFSSRNGQLFDGSLRFSTSSGSSSAPFVANPVEGDIMTTFALIDGSLVWQSPLFTNGAAMFCSQGGILIAVFDGAIPPECIPAKLVPLDKIICLKSTLTLSPSPSSTMSFSSLASSSILQLVATTADHSFDTSLLSASKTSISTSKSSISTTTANLPYCPRKEEFCTNVLSCIDLSVNVNHCGSCINACSLEDNSIPTCISGLCGYQCNTGFDDCDSLATNGCEVDLLTDSNHCSSCNNACVLDNASSQCSGGSCVIVACDTGFDNCDATASNGCEVDLNTDVNNCGQCGNICTTSNGTPTCNAGVCAILSCNTGFADCDNNPINGCEVNLVTDVSHCGTCSTSCSLLPNVLTTQCQNSACQIDTCQSGYNNCDANSPNGCEIYLLGDARNCGTCGRVCALPNAVATCSSGQCAIAICKAGFADCDGIASNGCEINLQTNPQSCGSCGNVCNFPNAIPGCSSGQCTITSCASGYQNCDGSTSNGCELNWTASCTQGCAPGYACSASTGNVRVYQYCDVTPFNPGGTQVTSFANSFSACQTICRNTGSCFNALWNSYASTCTTFGSMQGINTGNNGYSISQKSSGTC